MTGPRRPVVPAEDARRPARGAIPDRSGRLRCRRGHGCEPQAPV